MRLICGLQNIQIFNTRFSFRKNRENNIILYFLLILFVESLPFLSITKHIQMITKIENNFFSQFNKS